MKIIAIEANIGAGKTTLLEPLRQQLETLTGEGWEVIVEPVDEDPEFHRLLKQFIDNPTDADKRVEFQLYLTHSRQSMLKDIPDGNYLIERSLFSDLVFCQANFLALEKPSAIYMDYYYEIKRCLTDYPQIDAVVYLRRDYKACAESCATRAREGEDGYQLDYFFDLEVFHDACLPQITRQYNTKLLTIELNTMYASAPDVASNIMEMLQSN